MKKMRLLLFSSLIVMLLTACSNPAAKETTSPVAPETKEALRVTLVVENYEGDMAFVDQALGAMRLAEEKLGIVSTIISASGEATEEFEQALEKATDQGDDLIIASGGSFRACLGEVAKANPEQKYVGMDFELETPVENVYCLLFRDYENGFLAGALAAQMSESKQIGFIGGIKMASVENIALGFQDGAAFIDPNVVVTVDYLGGFLDEKRAKEMALERYDQGADVICHGAGRAGLGVVEAAVEESKWVIGSDSDQWQLLKADGDEAGAERILTSVLKRMDQSIYYVVEMKEKGQEMPFGTTAVLGLKEEAIGLADNANYQKQVPQEIRDKMAEISEKLASGELGQ